MGPCVMQGNMGALFALYSSSFFGLLGLPYLGIADKQILKQLYKIMYFINNKMHA